MKVPEFVEKAKNVTYTPTTWRKSYVVTRLDKALKIIEVQREALDKIASWGEGKDVNSSFDEPVSAKIARTALGMEV